MRPLLIMTLEDICIESIVQNFEQLMAAYNSGSCSIPRKYFEFLQRTYSETILDKLAAIDVLQDDCLAFLINPYQKRLDLRSSSIANSDVVIERLKEVGKEVISLDMREKYFPEEVIVELVSLIPNVEALYLSQTEATDNVLRNIGKYCTKLHTLDMCFCKITEDGLISLCEKDTNGELKPNNLLRNLHIAATTVSDKGVIFALAHFPILEVLDHDNVGRTIYNTYQTKFFNGTLREAPKYNLRKLDLFHLGSHYYGFPNESIERLITTDILKVCSTLCPRIASLYMDNVCLQEEIMACSDFAFLKEVKLSASPLIDYSPLFRTKGCTLVRLELESGVVSVEALSKFCPKLESVTFQSVHFDKFIDIIENPPAVPSFQKMRTLTLQDMILGSDVTECLLFLLKSCPRLLNFSLPYCRFLNDMLVDCILECECVEKMLRLDFSYTDVNISFAQKMIMATPNLEKIILEDSNISNAEYKEILASFRAENRDVEVVWKNGPSDYDSEYENDYEFFPYEYPFREYINEYDFDYMNDYDDEDYYDIDTDDFDYYDINDYL